MLLSAEYFTLHVDMMQRSVARCNIATVYLTSSAGRSNFVDSLHDVAPWCDVPYTPQNMPQSCS